MRGRSVFAAAFLAVGVTCIQPSLDVCGGLACPVGKACVGAATGLPDLRL